MEQILQRATKPFDYVYEQIFISIHALVKRATFARLSGSGATDISIHALVKRATGGHVST